MWQTVCLEAQRRFQLRFKPTYKVQSLSLRVIDESEGRRESDFYSVGLPVVLVRYGDYPLLIEMANYTVITG